MMHHSGNRKHLILSALMTVIFLVNTFMVFGVIQKPCENVYAEENDFSDQHETEDENKLILDNNFDSGNGAVSCSGSKIITLDNEHGKSLMFDTTSLSTASAAMDMPKRLSDGIYAISFDYYAATSGIYNAIRLKQKAKNAVESDKSSGTVAWVPTSDMICPFLHTESETTRADAGGTSYKRKDWGKVVIWIDFIKRKQTYFIDGKLIATTGMPEGFNGFNSITMEQNDGANFPGKIYFDNIKIWEICDTYKNPIEKQNTPNYLHTSVFVTNTSKNIGNIFYYDSDFNFETTFENLGKAGNYDVEYSVIDDYGDEVWKQNETIYLNKDEEIVRHIEPKVEKYGLYTYRVEVGNEKGVGRYEFRCSKANVPPIGEKNYKFGVCTHFRTPPGQSSFTPGEIILPLIDLGGYGMIRDEPYWRFVEQKKGVYSFTDRYKAMLDYAQAHDIEVLNILGYENLLYAGVDDIPLDGELKIAFDNFVDFTAKEMKKMFKKTYLEGWNEFNLKNGKTPEQYAILMKNMHSQIKKSDPNATFVAMCTALTPLDWIERVLIALGDNPGQYMDVISTHPYDHMHTPETGVIIENTQKLRNLLDSYGCQNVKIWWSELGWTATPSKGFLTEWQQGYYATRALLLNDAKQAVDKFIWYDFHNDAISETDTQKNWGMIRNASEDVPASAKYSYLTTVNYNKLVGNAHFKKEILSNDECFIYRYSRDNKSDILALGTLKEITRPTSLYVGCDSVNVIDGYGNSQKVKTIEGIVTLPLDAYPKYIEGDFCDRIYEVEPLFSLDKDLIKTAMNTTADINVKKRTNLDAQVYCETPPGIELVSQNDFEKDTAETVIRTSGAIGKKIIVNIKNGDDIIYSQTVPIEYVSAILISDFKITPNAKNKGRRMARLDIKNMLNDKPISGTIKFNQPECMAGRSIEVKDIQPGEKRTVAFPLPEATLDIVYDELSFDFENNLGEAISFTGDMKLPLSVYANKKPAIDGELSEQEWDYGAQMDISGMSMVGNMQGTYKGINDLSAVAYSMWDEDNFYFMTRVTDNIFCQDEEPKTSYKGDGIQMAFAEGADKKTGTELGISIYPKNSEECAIYCFSHTENADKVAKLINGEARAKRNGIYTIYEARIPWSEIFYEGFRPKAGDHIRWSLLYNENDGTGRLGFLQYGGGIGTGKSVAQYLDLELRK